MFSELPPFPMSLFRVSTDSDTSDKALFDAAYWQITSDHTQSLLDRQSNLERLSASNMVELTGALARQSEAYCRYGSSFQATFPAMSDEDINSILQLDFKTLENLAGDLALHDPLVPCSTGQISAITAAVSAAAATPIILTRRFSKKRSTRPAYQKPAKKFAPSSKTGDDLPTPTI